MGEESLSQESVDPDLFSQRALENDSVLMSQQPQQLFSRPDKRIPLREMQRLVQQLGYAVGRINDVQRQRLFMGAVVKFTEVANGNDFEDCESLDNAINCHLNLSSSTSHLSQFSQENQENDCPMRRSCPPGPQSRKRLKSGNEMTVTKIRDSNKRRSQCGFCLVVGHCMTGCQERPEHSGPRGQERHDRSVHVGSGEPHSAQGRKTRSRRETVAAGMDDWHVLDSQTDQAHPHCPLLLQCHRGCFPLTERAGSQTLA